MSVHRTYKTKIGSATRVTRERTVAGFGNEEHRTSNAELRTPYEDSAAPSPPESDNISSTPDDVLLSPPNGERNEVRGFDDAQDAETSATDLTNLNRTSSALPTPPLHGREKDGSASEESTTPSGEHRTFNIERRTSNEDASHEQSLVGTSHLDVRAPTTGRDGALAPSPPVQRAEQITPTIQITPNVAPLNAARTAQAHRPYPSPIQHDAGAPASAPITRQELQRELASLRRLIESRK